MAHTGAGATSAHDILVCSRDHGKPCLEHDLGAKGDDARKATLGTMSLRSTTPPHVPEL